MWNHGQSVNNGGSLDTSTMINGRNFTEPWWYFQSAFPRR